MSLLPMVGWPNQLMPETTSIAATIVRPSLLSGDVDLGFLLDDAAAPGAGCALILDYSGTGPKGEIGLQLLFGELGTGGKGTVVYDDGFGNQISKLLLLTGWDRFEITGTVNGDEFVGGSGQDIFHGGGGADNLTGGAGGDTLNGGTGGDTIAGGDDDDTLNGDDGNDFLYGEDGRDIIHGGDDDDTILGGAGQDNLYGDDGNDSLNGGTGVDYMDGGAGNDIIYIDNFGETAIGGTGIDTLVVDLASTSSNSNIETGDDADFAFNVFQWITGVFGSGDNTLTTRHQHMDLDTGLGHDVGHFDFSGTYLGNTVTQATVRGNGGLQGSRTDFSDGSGFNYTVRGFNELHLTGSSGDDLFIGTTGNDTLNGEDGDDTLQGDSGADTINGGDGEDTITGGFGADILNGGGDNDVFLDVDLLDTIDGGDGLDLVELDFGSVTVSNGFYIDLVNSTPTANPNFTNVTFDNVEYLTGTLTDEADTVRIHGSSNGLDGGEGSDGLYIFFNTFNEFTSVNNIDTASGDHFQLTRTDGSTETAQYENFELWVIRLSDGDDRFMGTEGSTSLYGLDGDDELYGWDGAGNNGSFLFGGDGDDTLVSGVSSGTDRLFGGDGEDTLVAASRSATMTGDAGADTFRFLSNEFRDSNPSNIGIAITDFETGIDVLDFSQFGAAQGAILVTWMHADGKTETYGINAADRWQSDVPTFRLEVTQSGSDVWIMASYGYSVGDPDLSGDGEVIELRDLTLDQVSMDDFLF
ncbi:calcium-binding protein [Shimia ponticola]|uniref:calcium-binding protein n=1 Tax=Shimia ponticola TaxID=2582893 RepID=UPI0011BF8D34|nr:calcium-binding protein [Shimia ponticola]